jgi:beta-galactosidase
VIIGKDALDAKDSTSSRLSAFAVNGHAVIVLDQKNPLRYQGLPADMRTDTNVGRTAFGEDLSHPVLKGILQKDFFTWNGDEIVYRNAYMKPERGAKSLIQCHEELKYTGLAELPVGEGIMYLSQLVIGEKLATNAIAQQLLLNMINYSATYKLEFRKVVAAVTDAPKLAAILDGIGLKYTAVDSPIKAMTEVNATAVIPATPANLKMLADNLGSVKMFNANGGWIIFHGLTPDGIADYNKIVGVEHLIRPFMREKVTFSSVRNPLTAGLTLPDVALYSAERIFPWQSGQFISGDSYTYIVDYDEVASFAKFDNGFNQMMTNGMVSADAWKYIVNVPAPATPPLDFKMTLPREEELTRVEWIGNTFYYPVTKFQLLNNGEPKASFDVLPNNDAQTFEIAPSVKVKDLSLRLAAWDVIPGKNAVTGLDNIRLFAKRSPEFYAQVKPMLNIGGLMAYPKATGGIILCNINFKDLEDVPVNAVKKRTVLSTFLRNLKAPFAGSKVLIAGANMEYQPIDISKFANQYTDDRGGFGDNAFTLKDLPLGKQTLAGVSYNLYEFATSPVPTIIMLNGNRVPNKLANEVKGIPVNRKADALFFLQTARMDARRNPNEIKQNKLYDMAKYVITYADGKTVDVLINAEVDVENYKQAAPTAIPGAQIAWAKQYPDGNYAVVYSMQWNNPRPEADIATVDLVYGSAKRGVPALIAITAATVVK